MATFRELRAAARAHQKPKFDDAELVVNNSRADQAPMAVIPTGVAPELAPRSSPSTIPRQSRQPMPCWASTRMVRACCRSPSGIRWMPLPPVPWQLSPGGWQNSSIPATRVEGGHNQEGDGFRHAYWNSTMAKALGPDRAQQFANALEISSPNKSGERQMDLYNNSRGRALASRPGPMVDTIKQAIADGRIRTRPF